MKIYHLIKELLHVILLNYLKWKEKLVLKKALLKLFTYNHFHFFL